MTSVFPATARDHLLALGGYAKTPDAGVGLISFNDQTGEFGPFRQGPATPNPSFLIRSPSGTHVYACNEWGLKDAAATSGVSAFAVTKDAAGQVEGLRLLNTVPLAGGPCHLGITPDGKWVAAANYGAGSVGIFPVGAGGELGTASLVVQHSGKGAHPRRQSAPHAHSSDFRGGGKFLCVADLGLDKVLVYSAESLTLPAPALAEGTPPGPLPAPKPVAAWQLAPGAGPRHIAVAPSGKFAYVANEIDNTVTAFAVNWKNGTARALATLSTLPEGYTLRSNVAEIAGHPTGRWLFVSNRGLDSIALYALNPDTGAMAWRGVTTVGAAEPRHFTLDPSGRWLLVAGQKSRTLEAYAFDAKTGKLELVRVSPQLPMQPSSVLFLTQD